MSQKYIKPKNSFALPIKTGTYVPSTKNFDKRITTTEYNKRVATVKKWLSKAFGGYTRTKAVGGYLLKGKIVEEKVTVVYSFSTKSSFSKNRQKWYDQVRKWRSQWGQDSIGIEVEDDLYYIG